VNNNSMIAGFLDDLEKAEQAQSTAKGTMTAAEQDVLVLLKFAFSGEQVLVEQDRQQADRK
jgi:hypothetical protein